MPKRKDPALPPKEQFKRFIEAAQEHGVSATPRSSVALKSWQSARQQKQNRQLITTEDRQSREERCCVSQLLARGRF
jgi:hypothetical protein